MTQDVVMLTVNVHGIGPEAAGTPPASLYGRFAHGRYAYRGGLLALLERLRRLEVRATFFWPLFEAQRCRAELERCVADGHEIAAHGNAFEDPGALAPDREAELLALCAQQLAQWTGQRPVGFRSPTGTLSAHTIALLGRQGWRYDSSFVDDDAPYSLAADGAPGMVELPWSESLCDATHFRRRFSQLRAEAAMAEEFDPLLDADGYMCITLHPRGDIGVARPARLRMVDALVQRARQRGARFMRCAEVAELALVSGGVAWNGRPRPGLPAAVDHPPNP
jgi:peptidoglycan/xylan/chitin deacetylase (PgdA/CDA1 family)